MNVQQLIEIDSTHAAHVDTSQAPATRRRTPTAVVRFINQVVVRRFSLAFFAGLLAISGTVQSSPAGPLRGGVVAIAVDEATSAIFAATGDGLYRSSDHGKSWTPLPLPSQLATSDIAAVTVSARGKSVYVAARGAGVLHSENGGQSWTARNDGLPGRDVDALTAHADQADTLYAYVVGQGVFRSDDGGLHWRLMDEGPQAGILRLIHSNMPGSMQTGWLFAATNQGVRRAMDCFCGWRAAGELRGTVRAVAYDPRRPQRIYAATDEGLFLSANGGEAWSSVRAPAANIVALVGASSGALYAATADGFLFRTTDEAATWVRLDA